MIDRPQPWDLPQLDEYVEAVLRRMAKNRDVMSDGREEPYYCVYAAGIERDGKLRIDLEADLSGIGMPANTPITVRMRADTGPIAWSLDDTQIATTDRSLRAEEAGDTLTMDTLLEAHRKWVVRGSGGKRSR